MMDTMDLVIPGFCGMGTVSYTHLDVYKRQLYGCGGKLYLHDGAFSCAMGQ